MCITEQINKYLVMSGATQICSSNVSSISVDALSPSPSSCFLFLRRLCARTRRSVYLHANTYKPSKCVHSRPQLSFHHFPVSCFRFSLSSLPFSSPLPLSSFHHAFRLFPLRFSPPMYIFHGFSSVFHPTLCVGMLLFPAVFTALFFGPSLFRIRDQGFSFPVFRYFLSLFSF